MSALLSFAVYIRNFSYPPLKLIFFWKKTQCKKQRACLVWSKLWDRILNRKVLRFSLHLVLAWQMFEINNLMLEWMQLLHNLWIPCCFQMHWGETEWTPHSVTALSTWLCVYVLLAACGHLQIGKYFIRLNVTSMCSYLSSVESNCEELLP